MLRSNLVGSHQYLNNDQEVLSSKDLLVETHKNV